MGLQEIVAQIKELKVYAEENVDSGPMETLAGRRGRKSQAISQLAQLTRKYKQEMLQGAIFIVVTGAQKDAFSAMAVENFNCFASDPEEFYADLTSRIPSSLYLGKESIVNAFDTIGRHLEDKMMELDVLEYPQVVFRHEYAKTITNREEFQALVKQAVNEQVGAEIAGIQAVNSLLASAIDKNHAGKLTPIILATDDEAFVTALNHDLARRLTSRVFVVVAGKATKAVKSIEGAITIKEPTQEVVGQVMNTIKNTLKK